MAHALTVQAHDFPGGAGRPEGAQDPVVPTTLKGLLHVAPHLASHFVVHHNRRDDAPTIAAPRISHCQRPGNGVAGMAADTHVIVVQIAHHHGIGKPRQLR